PEVLGGFLAGATVSGVLMGMFQNNAGGAWDNAKKSFEKGVDINGKTFYKGSEPHKASVTGDTVGDPFKDTSGPSMNILIKLMSIVSLVIAPTLAVMHKEKIENNRKEKLESLTKMMGITTAETIDPGMDAGTTVAAQEVRGTLNADGDYVYDTGNIREVKLANKSIPMGENSQLYAMYNGIQLKDQKVLDPNKWYTIENLHFLSGSSDLKPGSEAQLTNLAEIMNAYPTLRVKLGGYTDDTGNPDSNMKLSNLRAQTAKLKLLEMGISGDRIEAEGYGPLFPICEANDTDECKAQNRRIDVRVLSF
ncbi:MAG: sodium/proton-translocating pyrophosphatase, partial [Kaistella sp.]